MLRTLVICAILTLFLLTPLGAQSLRQPGERDRCPVCGMFVAPYPEWLATLVRTDGTQLFFDGCKDLFRYYFNLQPDDLAQVQAIFVTDYYRTQLLPASEVYYVTGSDVYGPMGKELIPIAGKQNAETFMLDHNGKQILSFEQLSVDVLPGD